MQSTPFFFPVDDLLRAQDYFPANMITRFLNTWILSQKFCAVIALAGTIACARLTLAAQSWPKELAPLASIVEPLCLNAPALAEAGAALRIQIRREKLQSRYWIPTVQGFASYGIYDSDSTGVRRPEFLDNSRSRLGLSAELNFSPILGPELKSQREKLKLKSAEYGATLAYQEKLAEAIDLVLSLTSLKSRSEDLELTRLRLERQYKSVQANVRAGVQKRRDENRFEADLLRNSEARLGLQRSILESEARLATLIGSATNSGSRKELDWKSLFELKLDPISSIDSSPKLELARIDTAIKQIDNELAIKETGLTLGFSSGFESANSSIAPSYSVDSIRSPFVSSWFLLFQLRYPIWDNGADALKRFESSETERIARLSEAQALREFEATKALLMDEQTRLEQRIRLASRLRELENRSFQIVAADYREGRAGYLDWIGASQSLQESVRAQIELASEWAKLWMKVKRLKGEMSGGLCETND